MSLEQEFDYEECFTKYPNFSKADLQKLRQWVEEQDNTSVIPKNITDQQLLLFYNACKLDIDDTKKCVKAFYNIRDSTPEQFNNRDLSLPIIQELLESLEYFILPGVTNEGYGVVFHRLHDFDPEKYHYHDACKLLYMTIDACSAKNGPLPGFVFLFDMKGVKLGHIPRCPINGIAKFCQYVQEALPVSMKAIHVMNTSPFIDKVLFLLKPFLKKEVFKMINLHHPDEDLESFYRDHIPKRMLPPDFGGESPDTQTLHKRNYEILKSLQSYFDAEEQQRNACSKRLRKKGKIDKGFQDLCID